MHFKTPNNFTKLFKQLNKNQLIFLRSTASKTKYLTNIEPEISTQFDTGLRYRQHSGRRHLPTVYLPTRLESAALQIISKHNCQKFKEDVLQMYWTLHDHQLPPEPQEVEFKKKEIKERIAAKDGIHLKRITEEERIEVLEKRDLELKRRLSDALKNHHSIEYDEYSSVVYMTARLPPNFAALISVFNGIKKDLPEFKPKTLFDFGSGVGTTIWAAEEVWPKAFDEYFCVDISNDLNEISKLLLSGGKENKKPIYDPVFYRQYLPVSHTIKYDLVVSAFSLLDVPDAKNRVHVIENLWHKTQDVLVIVEHGSRAGFAAVLEARNLILQMSGHKITANFKLNQTDSQLSTQTDETEATIVSPCSHDLTCPRQTAKGPVLCNFEMTYHPLNYGQKPNVQRERFSYVVIRKGSTQSESKHWPRIVMPVLTSHNKAICRMCCSDGQLKEVIFTKAKHDKHSYRCARISEWGDKFPADIYPVKSKSD